MTATTLREQMYRRWKKGEDYYVLAKEMGVTRERMRIILKKMDAEVPLVDRIEAQAAEIEWLEKACAEWAEVSQSTYQRAKAAEAKLAKAVEALERVSNSQPRPKRNGDYDRSDVSALQRIARTTLAELTGGKDE